MHVDGEATPAAVIKRICWSQDWQAIATEDTRGPHDIVLKTQVVRLQEDPSELRVVRMRKFNSDIDAGLTLVHEQWGFLYTLAKRASRLVIVFAIAAFFMSKVGLLGSASATTSSSSLPAASTATSGMSFATAAATVGASATLVVASAVSSQPPLPTIDEELIFQASFDGSTSQEVRDDSGRFEGVLGGGADVIELSSDERGLELNGFGWLDFGKPGVHSGSVTVEAWVQPDGEQMLWSPIVNRWYGDGYYWLGSSYSPGGYEWWIEGTSISTESGLTPGRWQHVAGTFDAATGRLAMYVQGRLVGTAERSGDTFRAVASRLTIGGRGGGGWAGLIDEVRVWGGSMTQEEVCRAAGGAAGTDGDCVRLSPPD